MSHRMNEQELLARLAELPREMKPGRDLWPEIDAGITKLESQAASTKSSGRWWFQAAAASVVLILTAGVLLKPLYDVNAPSSEPVASNGTTPTVVKPGVRGAGSSRFLNVADAEYLAAFREFINAGESRSDLAPQTIEKIESGWADLRVTEAALTVALEENPGNLFLNERMLELRARQLGFLQQLVSLDRNNRRLTI